MLRKIQIKPNIITKIKHFEDSTVIYSKDEFWVCYPNQSLETDKYGLITLQLKDKCD